MGCWLLVVGPWRFKARVSSASCSMSEVPANLPTRALEECPSAALQPQHPKLRLEGARLQPRRKGLLGLGALAPEVQDRDLNRREPNNRDSLPAAHTNASALGSAEYR